MDKLIFRRKPMPLLPEYRPLFKIVQLLEILKLSSRGGKSSLIRLHLINWVLKDEKRKQLLIKSAEKNIVFFGVWGTDPALNFALEYAIAEQLVERVSISFRITEKGKKFMDIVNEEEQMTDNSVFLKSLGSRVTEQMVSEIVDNWG